MAGNRCRQSDVIDYRQQLMQGLVPRPTGTPDFPPPTGGGGGVSISAPIGSRENRKKHSKTRQK